MAAPVSELITVAWVSNFNFNGLGMNGGLTFLGFPDHRSSPMIMVMYGYNAVIKLNSRFGEEVFSETYYGFSAAAGYTFLVGKNQNRINAGIVFPFRNSAFKQDYDDAREASFSFNSKNPGVLITIGFLFAAHSR